ncbi:hypothetical protein HCH_05354 [Hahella chejuensis KCTC 2396]|uniref:Uncharacterized protein n=1 Tax=Hahella chejuensis (strain KCTC 2396) TaxID=349521 RepID=Q2SBE8_HAHCH|nr:hypothetical protein HCH_05354 [Hahella chejuensis KCTC 2396]
MAESPPLTHCVYTPQRLADAESISKDYVMLASRRF